METLLTPVCFGLLYMCLCLCLYLHFTYKLSLNFGLWGQFIVFLMKLVVSLVHSLKLLLLTPDAIQKHCLLFNTNVQGQIKERHDHSFQMFLTNACYIKSCHRTALSPSTVFLLPLCPSWSWKQRSSPLAGPTCLPLPCFSLASARVPA